MLEQCHTVTVSPACLHTLLLRRLAHVSIGGFPAGWECLLHPRQGVLLRASMWHAVCRLQCTDCISSAAASLSEGESAGTAQPCQTDCGAVFSLLPACRLRDDERKSPAVLSYLKEENAYTAEAMSDTQQLQDELYREMRARIQEADISVATRCGFVTYVSLRQALTAPGGCVTCVGAWLHKQAPGGVKLEVRPSHTWRRALPGKPLRQTGVAWCVHAATSH